MRIMVTHTVTEARPSSSRAKKDSSGQQGEMYSVVTEA